MAEPFLGEIRVVAFGFAPDGWAQCDGQLMPISQNDALFALIGTTFGGNGQDDFALPDLRGRVPRHPGPTHPVGESSGVEQVTLSLAQVPAHTHTLMASNAPATGLGNTGSTDPAGHVLSNATTEVYSNAGANTSLSPTSVPIDSAVTLPHSNMQPYLVLNFLIALNGIFPSQN